MVSRVFANEDFGYHKITVERPLRLNFAATAERIARLDDEPAFQKLATSKKRDAAVREAEVAAGQSQQDLIRALLGLMSQSTNGAVMRDREKFQAALMETAKGTGVKLTAAERKAVLAALAERDPQAETCRDRRGNPEPDPVLRDTETVPLCEDIDEYMAREVLPHAPDAWVDHAKTKIGYEIPLNRHFYVYEPPRPLEEIDADLQALEHEIISLLAEVTE